MRQYPGCRWPRQYRARCRPEHRDHSVPSGQTRLRSHARSLPVSGSTPQPRLKDGAGLCRCIRNPLGLPRAQPKGTVVCEAHPVANLQRGRLLDYRPAFLSVAGYTNFYFGFYCHLSNAFLFSLFVGFTLCICYVME